MHFILLGDPRFCQKSPYNSKHMGNVADPLNKHFYYACVHQITYHMACPAKLQYDENENKCL